MSIARSPDCRPMDFTGRPRWGFVVVDPEGIAGDAALGEWVQRGVTFASTLPAKAK